MEINKGDIVKFRECLEPGDEELRMLVLEVNDDRTTVEPLMYMMKLHPISMVDTHELEVVYRNHPMYNTL